MWWRHRCFSRDATLPGRLRRMRRKGSDPCGPRVCLFALSWCQVLLSRTHLLEPPPFRASTTTLWDVRTSKSLFRTGWRVGQRRAGRCGGRVLARAAARCRHSTRPLAMLPVLPRVDVSLLPLASAARFFALTPTSGSLDIEERRVSIFAAHAPHLSRWQARGAATAHSQPCARF